MTDCLESTLRNHHPNYQAIIEARLFALLKNLLAT